MYPYPWPAPHEPPIDMLDLDAFEFLVYSWLDPQASLPWQAVNRYLNCLIEGKLTGTITTTHCII